VQADRVDPGKHAVQRRRSPICRIFRAGRRSFVSVALDGAITATISAALGAVS